MERKEILKKIIEEILKNIEELGIIEISKRGILKNEIVIKITDNDECKIVNIKKKIKEILKNNKFYQDPARCGLLMTDGNTEIHMVINEFTDSYGIEYYDLNIIIS